MNALKIIYYNNEAIKQKKRESCDDSGLDMASLVGDQDLIKLVENILGEKEF